MITGVAVTVLEGAECAGVTLRRGGQFETVAATGDLALQVDALQYQMGSAPCVDAVVNQSVYVVDDLAHDARRPHFGRAAAHDYAVCSMLSYGLHLPPTASVSAGLNLYSCKREAFALPPGCWASSFPPTPPLS